VSPRLCALGLVGSVVSLAACHSRPPSHPSCVIECAQAPAAGLDGARQNVSLLLRSVLLPRAVEDDSSIFFVYVFFAEPSEATYLHRRRIAGYVKKLFSDVVERREVEHLLPSSAVLYVPMRSASEAAAREAIASADLDVFLDAYDYERARKLRRRIETETHETLPRVALIGSSRPIFGDGPLDLHQLYSPSLELPPEAIESRIIGFLNTLASPHRSIADTEASAARLSRGFFEALSED